MHFCPPHRWGLILLVQSLDLVHLGTEVTVLLMHFLLLSYSYMTGPYCERGWVGLSLQPRLPVLSESAFPMNIQMKHCPSCQPRRFSLISDVLGTPSCRWYWQESFYDLIWYKTLKLFIKLFLWCLLKGLVISHELLEFYEIFLKIMFLIPRFTLRSKVLHLPLITIHHSENRKNLGSWKFPLTLL